MENMITYSYIAWLLLVNCVFAFCARANSANSANSANPLIAVFMGAAHISRLQILLSTNNWYFLPKSKHTFTHENSSL